ncbi:unnamed protein product [Ectocarpus sp. 13 AM-2016]
MVCCRRWVLPTVLAWPVAHAYVQLGLHAVPRPDVLTTSRVKPQQRRSLCMSEVESCSNRRVGGQSMSPLGVGSTSREQFLGGLLASSAALLACTAAANAVTEQKAEVSNAPAVAGQSEYQQPPPTAVVTESESAASSAISGLVAGAAVSTSKQLLLYPVDTVKTRLQLPRDGSPPELFRGLYDGVLPPLLAGLPSGALFFSAKDAFSTAISNVSGGQYAELTTIAAVGLAQFPYWGIRTPAELLKIRSQAGLSGGSGAGFEGAKSILADEGLRGLYTGYSSNIAYAFPADAIKFLVYGVLKRSAKKAKGGAKLSTIEAAVLGSGASLAAQAVTTPLDVVRTRVMTASSDDEGYEGGVLGALGTISREESFSALWAGINPRMARSVLSGAIQFGSYEFVKGLFGVEPRKL